MNEHGLSLKLNPDLPDGRHEMRTIKIKREKYIISSKNALHEICGWSLDKHKGFEGVSADDVFEFAEHLIKRGVDVNAVCMRREERTKLIRDSVRKYRNFPGFKLKPLPADSTAFYISQTPLSLAVRAKNCRWGRCSQNMTLTQNMYPRDTGIKFYVESFDLDKLKTAEEREKN